MIPGEDHPYQMELPKVHIPVIPIICCETLKNLLLSVSHSSVKEIMKAHRIKNVLVTVPGTKCCYSQLSVNAILVYFEDI